MNNYEKKYKEALAKARRLHDEPTGGTERIVCEQIFPELMGSEDERIRKWLEEHIEAMPYNSIEFKDVKRIDVLYWLEMQGEQKFSDGTFVNVDDVREDFVNEVYRVLDADSTNDRANQIIDTFDNLPTVTIKQDPCEHCEHKYLNCHNFPCIEKRAFKQGKTILEAINEEKVDNANKVESKLKVGDWIICEELNTAKIVNINDDKYEVEFIDGNKGFPHIDYIDRLFHLWTIEDAKAGDVLAWNDSKCIAIFKNIYDEDSFNSCGFVGGCTGIFESRQSYHDIEGARPATKEQRDTLKKAMTDAGYTFDFEKKELKKIENEIEIPFGAKDSELIAESYYIPKGFHAEIDKDKVVIKKGKKPTEWSEKYIADVFEKVGLAKIVREQSNDALTIALQDAMIELSKVTLQPKPTAWSEEDENIKEWIMSDINKLLALNRKSFVIADKEITWLKSLKDRHAWKPSDEQIEALNYVVNLMASSGSIRENYYCIVFKDLREQLKKLK